MFLHVITFVARYKINSIKNLNSNFCLSSHLSHGAHVTSHKHQLISSSWWSLKRHQRAKFRCLVTKGSIVALAPPVYFVKTSKCPDSNDCRFGKRRILKRYYTLLSPYNHDMFGRDSDLS